MAVTITSPQSKVVARGTVTLSWTCQYPQTSYEIQYRQAGQSAWSTFGQVSGAATSVTLNLSVFEDFGLYHYRVVSYASNATSGTSTYNGSDFSAAYAIMVVPANQVATMKIKYGSGMEEVPLYSETTRFPKLVTPHGQNPLLADTEYAAGQTRARVGSTNRAVAIPPSSLPATGQPAYAYITQRYRYSERYYRYTTGYRYYVYYTTYTYYPSHYTDPLYQYASYSYDTGERYQQVVRYSWWWQKYMNIGYRIISVAIYAYNYYSYAYGSRLYYDTVTYYSPWYYRFRYYYRVTNYRYAYDTTTHYT